MKQFCFSKGSQSGTILILSLIMLIGLIGVIVVFSLVLGMDQGNQCRYESTLKRMYMVKKALLGDFADIPLNGQVSACGGFISDFGEPDLFSPFTPDPNFMGVLINPESVPAWQRWWFSPSHKFWAGYRGDRYLIPPPDEWTDVPPFPKDFLDGWGNPIQVLFNQDTAGEYTVVRINSAGSDGLSGGSGKYKEDIEDSFYWKKGLNLTFNLDVTELGVPDGTDVDIEITVIYPFHGAVTSNTQTVSLTINHGEGTGSYNFPKNPPLDMSPFRFPAGLRKLVCTLMSDLSAWNGPVAGTLISEKKFLIPSTPVVSSPAQPPDGYNFVTGCKM